MLNFEHKALLPLAVYASRFSTTESLQLAKSFISDVVRDVPKRKNNKISDLKKKTWQKGKRRRTLELLLKSFCLIFETGFFDGVLPTSNKWTILHEVAFLLDGGERVFDCECVCVCVY